MDLDKLKRKKKKKDHVGKMACKRIIVINLFNHDNSCFFTDHGFI